MKKLLSISLLMMVICSACNRLHESEITHLAFKAEEDSRWGLIDWEGNPLIENEFTEEPSSVFEGRFSVKNDDGLYEFYTAEKKFRKIGKEYVQVGHFNNGLAPVVEKDKPVSFIHLDGTLAFVFDTYKNEPVISVSNFSEGLAYFKTLSGKYGYIDTKGKVVIDAIYKEVSLFEDGLSIVQKDNDDNNYVINKEGKELFHYRPSDSDSDFIADGKIFYTELISDLKCFGIMDKNGNKILKASTKYKQLRPACKDYLIFENKVGNEGLIDKKENIIIRAKYEGLYKAGDIFIYEHNGRKGILSCDGTEITEPKYDEILLFGEKGKYSYAKDDNEWVLIDKKGNESSTKNFYKISVPEWYICVNSDYVNIQEEVNKVLKYINNDGSIDKVTYNTKPYEFAQIYSADYKVSDLIDKEYLLWPLNRERFFKVALQVNFTDKVIKPNYEQKWKENYYGNGHWENEITGYVYNEYAIPKTFVLKFEPTLKLSERTKEVFDAVTNWFEASGFTKLSTENEDNITSVFWEKNTSHKIHAGVHLFKKDKYISIAIGK